MAKKSLDESDSASSNGTKQVLLHIDKGLSKESMLNKYCNLTRVNNRFIGVLLLSSSLQQSCYKRHFPLKLV